MLKECDMNCIVGEMYYTQKLHVFGSSVLKPPWVGTRFPSEICMSILASITRARSQLEFDDEV